MISYILFDLDNTLYPESSILGERFEKGINSFVARYLGISEEEARRQRRERRREFGTTLQWLTQVHNFTDIDNYMDAVHPKNMKKYLEKNPALTRIVRSLPVKRSILTNSPREHAERVLSYLEIIDQFEHIFDLRYNNFIGKPDPGVYQRILTKIDRSPEETLFVDDIPGYLEPFRRIGGHALLIDELGRHPQAEYPVISRIEELPAFLEREYGITLSS
ncbi:HAD-IA family hydrolase [Marispirochaeta sp.]|jgi:putative hydrolase of the HAD superfamily|uniref:HAD-IA family hydrolase n=1 Tax=Marispirochaeta sp. TaxID=2038653 RepID=UPI0029C65641|nr:HAD-IA family hydrolase [Marispirochaeta sp.]